MKLLATAIPFLAACLPLAKSFQNVEPASRHAPSRSSASPSSLSFSDVPTGNEAELEDVRRQFADMTAALDAAKERQAEAREAAELAREERAAAASATEQTVASLKRSLSDRMTTLSDRIEGAQDDLVALRSTTISEISSIKGEAHERQERLYSEISDLESRLAALRREGADAAKERDALKKSLAREERETATASRRELNDLKRAAGREKKELSRERWALEGKIQRAGWRLIPSLEELEAAKRQYSVPEISSLKEALAGMKNKMSSQVETLQKKRLANELSFDEQLRNVKKDADEDLDRAKSVYEGEISEEERALENATSYFVAELGAREKELQRTTKLAAKPVEYSGFGAIEEARNKLAALWDNKQQAIANAADEKADAMATIKEQQSAIADQYDAEYENARRNLQAQEARGERQLRQEDQRRERRREQLQREMRDLTRKLSRAMREETAAAEEKHERVKREKTAKLADNAQKTRRATNEIETVRSDAMVVQCEMKNLEKELRQKQRRLSTLEEERASFRKQARRTMSVAFSRITRRGAGARRK